MKAQTGEGENVYMALCFLITRQRSPSPSAGATLRILHRTLKEQSTCSSFNKPKRK